MKVSVELPTGEVHEHEFPTGHFLAVLEGAVLVHPRASVHPVAVFPLSRVIRAEVVKEV